jgi:hypothetical protein
MHKAYKKSLIARQLSFIFHTNTCLAVQSSINKHVISGLVSALKQEKKKRSCRKQLNLVREETKGPQFFGPAKVLCAIAYSD